MKIVRTKRYLKDMKRLGAQAVEMSALEQAIATDPTIGDVIPGLRGLRKVRFGLGGKGKRGGGRAIYFLIVSDETAIMIMAYAKARQVDMSEDDRRLAMKFVEELTNDDKK